MKKTILLFLIAIPTCCHSQFRSVQSKDITPVEKYDSTYNIKSDPFKKKNVFDKYIGQSLTVLYPPRGIRGFTKKPKKTYVKYNNHKKYINRSFTIIDTIEEKDKDLSLLKLKDNNTGEIVYFDTHEISYGTLFLDAYRDYLQKTFIGEKFYYISSGSTYLGIMKDMNTGDMFHPTGKEIEWTFKEIVQDKTPQYSDDFLCALFVDENGREAITPLYSATDISYFINVDHARILYGTGQDAQDILEGKVRIGWTKQQCINSWGMPKTTHTTIVEGVKHEQLVYDDGYLYFEDGILTAIQQ